MSGTMSRSSDTRDKGRAEAYGPLPSTTSRGELPGGPLSTIMTGSIVSNEVAKDVIQLRVTGWISPDGWIDKAPRTRYE